MTLPLYLKPVQKGRDKHEKDFIFFFFFFFSKDDQVTKEKKHTLKS